MKVCIEACSKLSYNQIFYSLKMKILMLGWEYPPHISGGLGTACEGLSLALAACGTEISFVVPHLKGDEKASHMSLIDSIDGSTVRTATHKVFADRPKAITNYKIASFLLPYLNPKSYQELLVYYRSLRSGTQTLDVPEHLKEYIQSVSEGELSQHNFKEQYGSDIFEEVDKFAANVLLQVGNQEFDVIHAHDWMTFPAGVAISKLSGKPLVVHIHSLEFDRSGSNVNAQINQIEKMGLEAAQAVIAVSYYTASIIHEHHAISPDKIHVVHNGVYPREVVQSYRNLQGWPKKVVLFLGRITFQKGPDYFVEAAARVVPHIPDVLFVMAGAGDMLSRMVDRVHQLAIDKHFYFPGFLKGAELERILSIADLYVMPSVSEPFGITALEAISYDTPVIISKQSGVSEVLGHALKVDFWDIDRMADLIINGLIHEELRADMVSMAQEEIKRLRWEAAALKTLEVYRKLM